MASERVNQTVVKFTCDICNKSSDSASSESILMRFGWHSVCVTTRDIQICPICVGRLKTALYSSYQTDDDD